MATDQNASSATTKKVIETDQTPWDAMQNINRPDVGSAEHGNGPDAWQTQKRKGSIDSALQEQSTLMRNEMSKSNTS